MKRKKSKKSKSTHNSKYEKTERAIQVAIHKLLRTHRGRVTAIQVAKATGLSRQTFYNHHASINQAVIDNETALMERFTTELDEQMANLSKIIPGQNARIFFAVLFFMAQNKHFFCPLCSDDNNLGLLYQMMRTAYPLLEITWLPKGLATPQLGDERVDDYLHRCVGIILRWGRVTKCDIGESDYYINKLVRVTNDAARNRI